MRAIRFFLLIFGVVVLMSSAMLAIVRHQSMDAVWKIVFTQRADADSDEWVLVEIKPTGRVKKSPTILQGDLIWSPDEEWVLFTELDGTFGRRLVLAKVDGSQRQVLIEDAKDVVNPIWSPDGEWILFADQISDRHRDVFRMRRDGSERIAFGLYDFPYCCRYSADAETMLFYWHHDDTGSVYRIGTDGTNPRHIVTTLTDLRNTFVPFTTSDGEWILFVANNAGQHGSIFRVRTDGSGLEAVSPNGDFALFSPSPDGEWIAYSAPTPNRYSSDIFRIKNDGSQVEQLTRDIPIQPYGNSGYAADLIWSPDGERLTLFSDCKLYEISMESKVIEVVYEGCFTGQHQFLPMEGKSSGMGWGVLVGVVMVGVGLVVKRIKNGLVI